MTLAQIPDRLRREIERDFRAVRPLRPPSVRLLLVAAWSAVFLVFAGAMGFLRPDLSAIGFWAGWGSALAGVAIGSVLVWLSLREAVPGAGLPVPVGAGVLLAAYGVHAATAISAWLRQSAPVRATGSGFCSSCFSLESAMGIPALVLTVWLVVRAYPVRPVWAGVLGGAGAGILADGVQHLLCPLSDLRHLVIWHGGAVLALAAVGGLAGWSVHWRRQRRLSSATERGGS